MAARQTKCVSIWGYMQQTDEDVVVCLTSNLIKHLCTRHPLEYAKLKEENDAGHDLPKQSKMIVQPTLIDTITKATPYRSYSNKKEINNPVVRMIVEDLQPLLVVEDKGFGRLIHGLNSYNS